MAPSWVLGHVNHVDQLLRVEEAPGTRLEIAAAAAAAASGAGKMVKTFAESGAFVKCGLLWLQKQLQLFLLLLFECNGCCCCCCGRCCRRFLFEPLFSFVLIEDILCLHPSLEAFGVAAALTPTPGQDSDSTGVVGLADKIWSVLGSLVDPAEKGPGKKMEGCCLKKGTIKDKLGRNWTIK